MSNVAKFLPDLLPRPWSPDAYHGFQPAGLFVGEGTSAIEVAVATASRKPGRTTLVNCWKSRKGRRAAPVLLVVLRPGKAFLCGPSGESPPVYTDMDPGQVERLCCEVLAQPDRHAALRLLAQALPSLETALPGLNNEGLLALHELERGVPQRPDWAEAKRKAAGVLSKREGKLLDALGFSIEPLDNLTSLLRSGERRTALAVMLRDSESAEAGSARFNSLSPISYAFKKADDENLPWVVLTQGNRLRLYATGVDAGVGRRGRTETYIECQPSLLAEEHIPYLWLLYSAEALAPDGSLEQILEGSQRFAGNLAERLRERIYDHVVPELARGIAAARQATRDAHSAIRSTATLCDLIAAQPISEDPEVTQSSFEDWKQIAEKADESEAARIAQQELGSLHALHFPVAFPEVFLRDRPGFDVIIGNPPWQEATVEEHAFWARHFPGLRGRLQGEQETEKARLQKERPDLVSL